MDIDGNLGWCKNEKRKKERQIEWVLRSIAITRNNLFHGGKFPFDQVRDTKLLYYGLIILYACLDADEEFSDIFSLGS